jgi:hypothetical protein
MTLKKHASTQSWSANSGRICWHPQAVRFSWLNGVKAIVVPANVFVTMTVAGFATSAGADPVDEGPPRLKDDGGATQRIIVVGQRPPTLALAPLPLGGAFEAPAA